MKLSQVGLRGGKQFDQQYESGVGHRQPKLKILA